MCIVLMVYDDIQPRFWRKFTDLYILILFAPEPCKALLAPGETPKSGQPGP